jgi:hypothetical protein
MADIFESYSTGIIGPARSAFAITKNDSTVFAQATRALYVGGAGAVTVRMIDGTNCTFAAVPAGTTISIRVDKVLSTGTDATSIVGLY